MAATTPEASRPHIPGYGIPEDTEGLLPWSHVTERLERARNYWICTSSVRGRPHAVPVWGAWVNDTLYFGAGPRSARNLAANPQVSIHLESGDEVVILEGMAELVTRIDPARAARLDDVFAAKYNWRPSSDSDTPVGVGMYTLHLRKAYAWTRFPTDTTRWVFEEQQ